MEALGHETLQSHICACVSKITMYMKIQDQIIVTNTPYYKLFRFHSVDVHYIDQH